MSIQSSLSGATMGDRLSLAGGAAGAVTLVVYAIYGVMFNYFDVVVCVCLAAAAVLGIAAVLLEKATAYAGILKIGAVFSGAYAFALFFYNSYPVWADEINHITMYNSRGGLVPVIALCVLFVITLLGLAVSCFMKDGGSKAV